MSHDTIHISPDKSISLDLKEIIGSYELFIAFVWKDITVRYRQTILGFLWAIIQPLVIMVIFTVIFGHFSCMPSEGIPYSIFFYGALLPWTYVSDAINRAASSMVGNASLITKVYFQRILIPLASITSPLVDCLMAFTILLGLMLYFQCPACQLTSRALIFIPILMAFAILLAMGISFWVAALNVKYRDFQYLVPFGMQILFFLSPIIYPTSIIPTRWLPVFSLNPLNTIITGFRWALFGTVQPEPIHIIISLTITILLVVSGFIYFKKVERYFSDLI